MCVVVVVETCVVLIPRVYHWLTENDSEGVIFLNISLLVRQLSMLWVHQFDFLFHNQ